MAPKWQRDRHMPQRIQTYGLMTCAFPGRSGMVDIQGFIHEFETAASFPGAPKKEMRMAVFNGERNDHDVRVRGTDGNQIECGNIVSLADNEIPGIGAIGADMEILLFHRFALTPHTPATDAMTLDDTSGYKSRQFR